ncbi:MAG: hypothetical protein V9E87_15570 [Gemmatimonadales bacterium]
MAKDACLGCGKTLPANKELASVPNGRLVAFDPQANRAWRICAKCHHWNLLGPEASAAAIPELVARFDGLASAGPVGLAKAKVSDKLELYRVGGPQERAAAILELSNARRELLGPIPFWLKVFFALYLPYMVYTLARNPPWEGWSGAALCFGLMDLVAERTKAQLAGRPVNRRIGWPIGAMLLGALATAFGVLDYRWALLALALGALFGWVARRDLLRDRAVVWTPGQDDLTFEGHDPKDLGHVLTVNLATPATITPEQVATAFERLDQLGGLAEVLRHLTAERGLPEGRLELNRLPVEDLALLALASRGAIAEPSPPIRAGLPDARAIAEVAESLDRPLGGA